MYVYLATKRLLLRLLLRLFYYSPIIAHLIQNSDHFILLHWKNGCTMFQNMLCLLVILSSMFAADKDDDHDDNSTRNWLPSCLSLDLTVYLHYSLTMLFSAVVPEMQEKRELSSFSQVFKVFLLSISQPVFLFVSHFLSFFSLVQIQIPSRDSLTARLDVEFWVPICSFLNP